MMELSDSAPKDGKAWNNLHMVLFNGGIIDTAIFIFLPTLAVAALIPSHHPVVLVRDTFSPNGIGKA